MREQKILFSHNGTRVVNEKISEDLSETMLVWSNCNSPSDLACQSMQRYVQPNDFIKVFEMYKQIAFWVGELEKQGVTFSRSTDKAFWVDCKNRQGAVIYTFDGFSITEFGSKRVFKKVKKLFEKGVDHNIKPVKKPEKDQWQVAVEKVDYEQKQTRQSLVHRELANYPHLSVDQAIFVLNNAQSIKEFDAVKSVKELAGLAQKTIES